MDPRDGCGRGFMTVGSHCFGSAKGSWFRACKVHGYVEDGCRSSELEIVRIPLDAIKAGYHI